MHRKETYKYKEKEIGETQDGTTDIACNTGDTSGLADTGHEIFYNDGRARTGMDRDRHYTGMYSQDKEMWTDHDDRYGDNIFRRKSFPEKCVCETPSLCGGQQCSIENTVPVGIFFPVRTQLQRICRSGDDL